MGRGGAILKGACSRGENASDKAQGVTISSPPLPTLSALYIQPPRVPPPLAQSTAPQSSATHCLQCPAMRPLRASGCGSHTRPPGLTPSPPPPLGPPIQLCDLSRTQHNGLVLVGQCAWEGVISHLTSPHFCLSAPASHFLPLTTLAGLGDREGAQGSSDRDLLGGGSEGTVEGEGGERGYSAYYLEDGNIKYIDTGVKRSSCTPFCTWIPMADVATGREAAEAVFTPC